MRVCRSFVSIALLMTLSQLASLYAQSSAPSFKTLFAFSCSSTTSVCPQGEDPNSLIQSEDGNLYGTTEFGGTGNQAAGTVFKLTPAGKHTTLHTFVADAAGNYPTGANPSSLIEGNDGFLYGTAQAGGADNEGVVFKLSKSGKIQLIHTFCSDCTEGNGPYGLVLGGDGNFYGCTQGDSGQLFRVTPTGSLSILHTFSPAVDGPQCVGMILASDGNLYGDTVGALSVPTVLFRVTPAGEVTDLHTWRYSQLPISLPTQTAQGTLWGVLSHIAGAPEPAFFSIDLSGSNYQETELTYTYSEGFVHYITQASDGDFWGTVGNFIGRFTPGGELLEQVPVTGLTSTAPEFLLQLSNGTLVGFTFGVLTGGDAGEIFAVEPALAPPQPLVFSFTPSSGAGGSEVTIQGIHFVGTTAVKFNGVSASFEVFNTGNIKATVPAGARTGTISITNAGGEAVSTASFTVE
jgi:uncharacterized repeat protein (TIGR03803 family)